MDSSVMGSVHSQRVVPARRHASLGGAVGDADSWAPPEAHCIRPLRGGPAVCAFTSLQEIPGVLMFESH